MATKQDISWGDMLYELRCKFVPYEAEELGNAVLNLHPQDFRKMLASKRDNDYQTWISPMRHPSVPWRAMGLIINETDLVPEGVLVLCNNKGMMIATVNIDDGLIRRN